MLAAAAGFIAAAATPAAASSAASAADAFRVDQHSERAARSQFGEGDSQFRSLHAQWGFSGPVAELTRPVVAVPSLHPVEMDKARMSSGFGPRRAPLAGASTNHKGLDFAAPTGTPIYATADGTVSRANWGSGYGKLVFIDHGNGIETRYAHLSARSVVDGDRVRKGDVIGYVGSTGRSTGPHLHYEIRVDGVAVDPVGFLIEAPFEEPVRVAAAAAAEPES